MTAYQDCLVSTPFKPLRLVLVSLALLQAAASFADQLPRVELRTGMFRISAEVAADYTNRATGLMNRSVMPSHEGMIFVYPDKAIHCMWMKNTLIPLSVAFLDDNGVVINVEEMLPQTEDNHCAKAPARFALEMNAGWFRSKNIGSGAVIKGIEKLPAAE